MIYGHDEILRALEGTQARVLLFLGSRSIGKWATAEWLREHWGIANSDLTRVHNLSMEDARGLVWFSTVAPTHAMRLAIVDLVGAAPAALNVLLKALEDAQPEVRFILIAEELPPETIASRAHLVRFQTLSAENVQQVLLDRKFGPAEAKRLAELSGGSIEHALQQREISELKAPVLAVLRAFRERSPQALDQLAGKWTDAHTELLNTWCRESITKDWKIFSEAESGIDGTQLQIKILMALKADIRPRLVIRSSLMKVLRGQLA